MNDWSDYALARLKKEQEDQRLKDEKFLEKQRIKKAHGTPLWHEVRRIVKENAEHLNTKAKKEVMVFEVTQNTALGVRANLDAGSRRLDASFNEETGQLSWRSGSKGGGWELAVTEDGGVQFQWGMVPTTPASIAKQMLDALLFD